MYLCPRTPLAWALLLCLMCSSKWIKFVGHYVRHPIDLLLVPLSMAFGYFHGLIKLYAVLTLHVVSPVSRSRPLFHLQSH